MDKKKKAGLVGLLGTAAHTALCPIHGIGTKIAVSAGVGSATLAPLYQFHEYITHKTADVLYATPLVSDPQTAHDLGHHMVDATGWMIAGASALYAANTLYQSRKKSHEQQH